MALKLIDRAIQVYGGAGVTDDFPLASAYAHLRTLRLADGPGSAQTFHRALGVAAPCTCLRQVHGGRYGGRDRVAGNRIGARIV